MVTSEMSYAIIENLLCSPKKREIVELMTEYIPGARVFSIISTQDLASKMKEIKSYDPDIILSVGGDGTAHNVLNQMFQEGLEKKIFGLVPAGSGNDFSMYGLGMSVPSTKSKKAIFRSIDDYIYPDTKQVDVGLFKAEYERIVLNSVGFGYTAEIAFNSQDYYHFGRLRYLAAGLASFMNGLGNYASRLEEVKINGKDRDMPDKNLITLVMNSKASGGGLMFNPIGSVCDGVFSFITLKEVGKGELAKLLWQVIKKKQFYKDWNVMYNGDVSKVSVASDTLRLVELDGEILPATKRFSVEVLPAKVRMITKKSEKHSQDRLTFA